MNSGWRTAANNIGGLVIGRCVGGAIKIGDHTVIQYSGRAAGGNIRLSIVSTEYVGRLDGEEVSSEARAIRARRDPAMFTKKGE